MTNTEKQAIDPVVTDIDIAQISSCDTHSMEECERTCGRYCNCQTVAYANDLLVEYENIGASNK